MIRIAVVMDQARVIGAPDKEKNTELFVHLPKELSKAMQRLYRSENAAGGEYFWNWGTSLAKKHRYVITRKKDFDVEGQNVEVVNNAQDLVGQYQFSGEELLIAGGLSLFKYFVPYAEQLDIAETEAPLPGDLIFDQWENEPLELIKSEQLVGLAVKTYKRKREFSFNLKNKAKQDNTTLFFRD